ncbi:MAG: hypothetical protein PF588_03805 [Candidatus Kapabacteria bacterium]|nr:hypothetical protein [Candidatus Kapabacteria bacterium]
MKRIPEALILLALVFILPSCGESKNKGFGGKYASLHSGTFTVHCEESLSEVMDRVFVMYDSVYTDANQTIKLSTARTGMEHLLAGETDIFISAREYLKDEDSLMKAYKVEPHVIMNIAEDALVFYTRNDFPYDTVYAEDLKVLMKDGTKKYKDYYPAVGSEPEFVITDHYSSEYANLKELVAEGETLKRPLKTFANIDLVRNYVRENKNKIGVGYLAQIIHDNTLKPLMISFLDSTGRYRYPHAVHQTNILRRYYPYIVTYRAYMLEDLRQTAWWFGKFVSEEKYITRHYLDYGIVPVYAKFKLIEED